MTKEQDFLRRIRRIIPARRQHGFTPQEAMLLNGLHRALGHEDDNPPMRQIPSIQIFIEAHRISINSLIEDGTVERIMRFHELLPPHNLHDPQP